MNTECDCGNTDQCDVCLDRNYPTPSAEAIAHQEEFGCMCVYDAECVAFTLARLDDYGPPCPPDCPKCHPDLHAVESKEIELSRRHWAKSMREEG